MVRHAAPLAIALALVAASCSSSDGGSSESKSSASVTADSSADSSGCPTVDTPAPQLLEVDVVTEQVDNGNGHVACDAGFDLAPPTSGDHFNAWQNCGFYTAPVRNNTAVHSLEHGAVWIAYSESLPADDVAAVEAAVDGTTHVLAAPYPGLKNPIVLSAWTRQLAVDSMDDPAAVAFIADFAGEGSQTAPEPGATCAGGVGNAPDQPDADYDKIFESL